MTRLVILLTALLILGSVSPGMQSVKNLVIPGEFIVEPPTLMNLGFEWKIQGDNNRNASVAVQYRKKGQREWKEALPLLRIGDEKVWRAREYLEYWTPRMFAGSILDLEEETPYECRLTMSDPDGVSNYQEFLNLADFRRVTGQELHGLELDYNAFLNVRSPDPSRPHAVYESRDMDFQLRPGSAAVDAGFPMSTMTSWAARRIWELMRWGGPCRSMVPDNGSS